MNLVTGLFLGAIDQRGELNQMGISIFQNAKNLEPRKTNLVDFLRSFGCFCIVWYHSNYYWNLTQLECVQIDKAKLFLISWAMPFFYISSFFYASKYGFNKAKITYIGQKMLKLTQLLVFTVGVYEILNLVGKVPYWQKRNFSALSIDFKQAIEFVQYIVHQVSSGGNTPAYFIFELIAMYPICYFFGLLVRNYNYMAYLIIGLMFSMGFMQIGMLKNITYHTSFYMGIAIAFLVYAENSSTIKKKFNFVLIIFLLVFVNKQTGEGFWPILAIVSVFKFIENAKWKTLLSEFGQKYSLFVFLFHLIALDLTGEFFNILNRHFAIFNPSILIYLIINFIGFSVTAVVAIIIKRKYGYVLTT